MSFPNMPDFKCTKLAQIQWSIQNGISQSKEISKVNIIQHYDVNCYLSKLIIIANDLNSHFHTTMKNELFQIDPKHYEMIYLVFDIMKDK